MDAIAVRVGHRLARPQPRIEHALEVLQLDDAPAHGGRVGGTIFANQKSHVILSLAPFASTSLEHVEICRFVLRHDEIGAVAAPDDLSGGASHCGAALWIG